MSASSKIALSAAFLLGCLACDGLEPAQPSPPSPAPAPLESPAAEESAPVPPPVPEPEPEPAPPPMERPVPLWESGHTEREVDAARADDEGHLLLDLGEAWTPYLFSERSSGDGEAIPHAYRETYLALARGEHPADHHGQRAARDKYLELFGIMPTLRLLRERAREVRQLECADDLDLAPLRAFEGFAAYRNNRVAHRAAEHFRVLERQVGRMIESAGVSSEDRLELSALDERQQRALREYRSSRSEVEAIRAVQARLECEGYFEGKGRWVRGALDWATHEALAEFERRHRVYGWGFIGGETLVRLRQTPMELEREAVVRVLTERAMHALGVLEDGSAPPREGEPRSFVGSDERRHEVPNFEEQLRARIVSSLGLDTPASTLDFLEGLGELGEAEERTVAIIAPELPEYYGEDMDIRVEIDRGDVWYEFPYDENGRERSQPVDRRPRTTVLVEFRGQSIPIARFGTTIGGWRTEQIDGSIMWRYKNSPVGERVWHQIVSAPVWMPPSSAPPRSLLNRVPGGTGAEAYRVNWHEIGPSYASAYGLVAAYHRQFRRRPDGTVSLQGDEGIRSHGSVDYMSIMRRHSHGCHRLHNHIAVRLMSWVLAHRAHRRVGHRSSTYHRAMEYEEHPYEIDIDRGGYVFQLERPLHVRVLEGRIRGRQATPIEHPLPRYDEDFGGYLGAEGQPVTIDRHGVMTPVALPDAGLDGAVSADGGVPEPSPNEPTPPTPVGDAGVSPPVEVGEPAAVVAD